MTHSAHLISPPPSHSYLCICLSLVLLPILCLSGTLSSQDWGPAVFFFINSVLTPTLMPWATTARMWTGGGWSLSGCRKGRRVAEASLVFEVIEEREEVLRVDSHFPEMSTGMTTPAEFNITFREQTWVLKNRGAFSTQSDNFIKRSFRDILSVLAAALPGLGHW